MRVESHRGGRAGGECAEGHRQGRRRGGAGDTLVILESMKMEIPVLAEVVKTIVELKVVEGEVVRDGDPIAVIEEK